MKIIPYAILFLFCASLTGCTSKYPPDWPKTYPCTVTVTKGGQPFEGVTVVLARTENHGSWAVAGVTNAAGVAEIETSWTKLAEKGAPEGTFAVTLNPPGVPMELSIPQVQFDAMPYDKRNAFMQAEIEKSRQKNALPRSLADPAAAKVQIEVKPDTPATLTIEIDDYR